MKAMVLQEVGRPLALLERADPEPGPGEVRLNILACGVCRTDLHVVDGELPNVTTPIVPGHEIVGVIAAAGPGVDAARIGERVGVGWRGRTCGACAFCRSGRENLCDAPLFTGYTRDGGFATHAIADARFTYPLPDDDDAGAAPLMCAGLIGWRSLAFAGEAQTIGLYGFGAAAHIVGQVAAWQGRRVYAFTRPGDQEAQAFARRLG